MSRKTTDLTSDLLFEMAVPEPAPRPKKRARPVTLATPPVTPLPPELEEHTPTLTVSVTPLRWCKPRLTRTTLTVGPVSWQVGTTSPPSDVPDVQP